MSFPTILLFLTLLHQTLAAPQAIVTTWPQDPPLPSICGVLSDEPACPTGYKCQPYVTRYCPELEPDELCGYCSSVPPKTSPGKSLTSEPFEPEPPRSRCPSGFTPDPRDYCIRISTKSPKQSLTPLFCPEGYTPDYRGLYSCRPTIRKTTTAAPSSSSPSPSPTHATPQTSTSNPCSTGSTLDYRGYCRKEPTPAYPKSTLTPSYIEIRAITTEVKLDLKCDTIRNPKCPSQLHCSSIKSCPPFIAFCPGTCVSTRWGIGTKVPTLIEDPAPTPDPTMKIRAVTTDKPALECDTIRSPKCPSQLHCSSIKPCPPFIAFCPGTCVSSRWGTPIPAPTFKVIDPIPTPDPGVKVRAVTTGIVKELECDTRHDPKCPEKLHCSEIRKCPPFIAFCPGTCVRGVLGTGIRVTTFIEDPAPTPDPTA